MFQFKNAHTHSSLLKVIWFRHWKQKICIVFATLFILLAVAHVFRYIQSPHPVHLSLIAFCVFGFVVLVVSPYYYRWLGLKRNSHLLHSITYTIDDTGMRESYENGPDVFMPWSSFKNIQIDKVYVVLEFKNGTVGLIDRTWFPDGAEAFMIKHLRNN